MCSAAPPAPSRRHLTPASPSPSSCSGSPRNFPFCRRPMVRKLRRTRSTSPLMFPSRSMPSRASTLQSMDAASSRTGLKPLERLVHGAEHFAGIAVVGGRHAFLGGAQQRVGVGLPTDQNRLLVLERKPGRDEYVLRCAEHRSRIELCLVEVDDLHGRTSLMSVRRSW